MKTKAMYFLVCVFAEVFCFGMTTVSLAPVEPYHLYNPMSPEYLQEHLRTSLPRLVLNLLQHF